MLAETNEFAVKLKKLGWKQVRFCQETGIHKQTIHKWVKYGTAPKWAIGFLDAMLTIERMKEEMRAQDVLIRRPDFDQYRPF